MEYTLIAWCFFGADDGIRTRDLRLTKAVRYLLCHISKICWLLLALASLYIIY